MRPSLVCLILCPFLLLSSCLPIIQAPPAQKETTQPPAPAGAGPYWHATSDLVTMADTLAYYTALKSLKDDELNREYQRLLEAAAAPESRLPHLQLVLMAVLPEQNLIDREEATRQLEMSRQDADFHRDLGNLLILLDDQLSSRQPAQSQSQGQQESQTPSRVSLKKYKKQGEELEACRRERDDLADKLQKLQEIERDMMEREFNK